MALNQVDGCHEQNRRPSSGFIRTSQSEIMPRMRKDFNAKRIKSHKETARCLFLITPPKFNMEPENDGFQKESPFPVVDFQVPC